MFGRGFANGGDAVAPHIHSGPCPSAHTGVQAAFPRLYGAVKSAASINPWLLGCAVWGWGVYFSLFQFNRYKIQSFIVIFLQGGALVTLQLLPHQPKPSPCEPFGQGWRVPCLSQPKTRAWEEASKGAALQPPLRALWPCPYPPHQPAPV